MKKLKLNNGYLEVRIVNSPKVSIRFVRNKIICFTMFREVKGAYLKSNYRINMTEYQKWYHKHKSVVNFPELEKRAFGFAQLLLTVRVADYFPTVSCEHINTWFGVFADNKPFIKHGIEKKVV
ncbi:hypothetical protein ACTJ5U_10085 [Streptococcus suis]|uniref:hypothetical protein n=1 Tax=Streptococcus suis TaxID=1307 RepID=UPI003F8C8322